MTSRRRPSEALHDFQAVWDQKPVLREVYGDIFEKMARQCGSGPTLEIGGGIGNLKQLLPNVWSSDIQYSERLDLVADAHRIPFADGILGNIVMLDVLHHLEFPLRFFQEATRSLRAGGRIIMVEPAITSGSALFFRLFHREPVDMAADPLLDGNPDPHRDPYASNQAIPTLIVGKHRHRFHALLPDLRISVVEWFSLVAYPLSGGFQRWSLLTGGVARRAISIEDRLPMKLRRHLAFRLLLRIDRR